MSQIQRDKIRWEIIRASLDIRRVRFSKDGTIFGAGAGSDDFKILGTVKDMEASGINALSI